MVLPSVKLLIVSIRSAGSLTWYRISICREWMTQLKTLLMLFVMIVGFLGSGPLLFLLAFPFAHSLVCAIVRVIIELSIADSCMPDPMWSREIACVALPGTLSHLVRIFSKVVFKHHRRELGVMFLMVLRFHCRAFGIGTYMACLQFWGKHRARRRMLKSLRRTVGPAAMVWSIIGYGTPSAPTAKSLLLEVRMSSICWVVMVQWV